MAMGEKPRRNEKSMSKQVSRKKVWYRWGNPERDPGFLGHAYFPALENHFKRALYLSYELMFDPEELDHSEE